MEKRMIVFLLLLSQILFSNLVNADEIQSRGLENRLTAIINSLKSTEHLTENQIQEKLAESGLDGYSRSDIRRLVRLLNSNRPDFEIESFLVYMERHSRRRADIPPVSKINNEALTTQEQSVVSAVLEDFQVNESSNDEDQKNPVIAVDLNGNFAVVWQDKFIGESNCNIYAQRYSYNGNKLMSNFQVNEIDGSSWQLDRPSIAMDASGNFIIVWLDLRNNDSDVYGQRFSMTGYKLGSNFQINDDNKNAWQEHHDVGMDENGNIVVVWQDERNGTSPENDDIYVQRFLNDGTKLGINFRVNDDNQSCWQATPALAIDRFGNFIVTWLDERNFNIPISRDLYAQRFAKGGAKIGTNFLVTDGSKNSPYCPVVTMNEKGHFIIIWCDQRNGVNNSDVWGQHYLENGEKSKTNFQINDKDYGGNNDQIVPEISMDEHGNFVVVWQDNRNGNTDIYAQKYNSNGDLIGGNYRVNNDVVGTAIQQSPDVKLVNGLIYYCWQDNRIPGQGYDIFARVEKFTDVTAVPEEVTNSAVDKFHLAQNYPNPFNQSTQISYSIAEEQPVQIAIYNLNGQEVRSLVNAKQSTGNYSLVWDGRNATGENVTSGVYLLRLTTPQYSELRKVILIR